MLVPDLPAGTTYVCDLCARPADPEVEECWRVDCRAHCGGELGDVYHGACILPWLKSAGKGISVTAATHGAHWPCPKGKGKGESGVFCKSWVDSASIIIPPKKEKKKKAPPLPVPPGKKPPDAAAAQKGPVGLGPRKAPKTTAGWGNAMLKRQQAVPQVTRGPPIEEAPKADPLGRKLPGASSQGGDEQEERALPPGYDPDAALPGNKNARKRAKAAAAKAAAAAAAAAAETGSAAGSGSRLTQQQLGPSSSVGEGGLSGGASTCSGPSGFGEGSGFRPAIDEQHRALMGGGKFITRPEDLLALLGPMALSSDDDEDWHEEGDSEEGEEEEPAAAAAAAAAPAAAGGGGAAGGPDVGQQQDQTGRGQPGSHAGHPHSAAAAHGAAAGGGWGGAEAPHSHHSSAASTPEGWHPASAAGGVGGAPSAAAPSGVPAVMTDDQVNRVIDQLFLLGKEGTAVALMSEPMRLTALRRLGYDHVLGLLQQGQVEGLEQAVHHMQQQLAAGSGGAARVAGPPPAADRNALPTIAAAAGGGGGSGGSTGGWEQPPSWQQPAAPRSAAPTGGAGTAGQQARPPPPGFAQQLGGPLQQQQQQVQVQVQPGSPPLLPLPPHLMPPSGPPALQQMPMANMSHQGEGRAGPGAAAAAPPSWGAPYQQQLQQQPMPQVSGPPGVPVSGPPAGPYHLGMPGAPQQQQQQQQQQQGYMLPHQQQQQQPGTYLNGVGQAGGAPGMVAGPAAPYAAAPVQSPTYAPPVAAPMAAGGPMPALPFLQPQQQWQQQQQQHFQVASGGQQTAAAGGFLQPPASTAGTPAYVSAPPVAHAAAAYTPAAATAAMLPAVPTAGAHKHLYAHHTTGGGDVAAAGLSHAVHQGPDGEDDEDQEALLEELVLMLT